MRFLLDYEKQTKDLAKTHQVEGNKLKAGKGNNFIRQISNPEDQKMKWIQKTLFIELLKKIIERIGSIYLNNLLKPEIIKTYLQIQRKFKTKHKGLLVLIELFGNSDQLINEYKEANKNKSLERDDDVDLVSIKSHNIASNLKNSIKNRKNSVTKFDENLGNLSVQHRSSKMSPTKQRTMRNIDEKNGSKADSELNFSVMSEFNIGDRLKENQEKLMYQPDSITLGKYKLKSKLSKNEERAIKEIEKVKLRRQRRLEDKLFEEERKQLQQEKLKNDIQRELNKRKIEHGILPKSKKKFQKDSIILDSTIDKEENLGKKKHQIDLYDFSLEEEKDQNDIKNFLRVNRKLLNFLFKSYANSGFYHKQVNTFDALHNRIETMSLSEAVMMLSNNSIIPELLHKEEAGAILRLVNAKIIGDKRENKALTFEAFNSYFLQIAMFVFGREPINLSQKPPVESAKALMKLFEKSAVKRGESIRLFENPEYTIIADNDVLNELNKLLKKNPNVNMPDGYKKIKIKEYKSEFKIPEYFEIPEKNKICLEIMDGILFKNFGFHIFEPISKPVYSYKAKPVLNQLIKFPNLKKEIPYVYK